MQFGLVQQCGKAEKMLMLQIISHTAATIEGENMFQMLLDSM